MVLRTTNHRKNFELFTTVTNRIRIIMNQNVWTTLLSTATGGKNEIKYYCDGGFGFPALRLLATFSEHV